MASRDMIGSKVDGLEESRRALEKIIRAEMAAIPGALELIGQQLTTEVKRRAPVATGTLRRSYNWETGTEGRDAYVEVGSNVDYACVLGAATSVVTDEGARRISAIRKGDHVLTQTGEYRPVVHVWKFPVTEKPDLVTIRARWRKGRDHTVTVTADHKVLVHRDGRNVWLPAAGLIVGDVMWKRRKVAANAGTAATRPCGSCGKPVAGRSSANAAAYCDQTCKNVAWADGANPHMGATRSALSRKRMSEAARARLLADPSLHPSRLVSSNGYRTSVEQTVEDWLLDRDVKFVRQHPVGRYVVDFWLPDALTVVEADGAYWHQDQSKDIARDRRLLDVLPDGSTISHLHFFDPRWSPDLDPAPLPGVTYVATNPGPSTWVDIETFDPAEVLEARQWTWEKGAGQRPPMLYDLGVDGVHSFVAHGLVVSNSYQEFGTSRQEGTPHLRPAVDALRPQIRALLAEHVGRGGAGAFRGIGGGLAGVARTLAGLARGGATL